MQAVLKLMSNGFESGADIIEVDVVLRPLFISLVAGRGLTKLARSGITYCWCCHVAASRRG